MLPKSIIPLMEKRLENATLVLALDRKRGANGVALPEGLRRKYPGAPLDLHCPYRLCLTQISPIREEAPAWRTLSQFREFPGLSPLVAGISYFRWLTPIKNNPALRVNGTGR